MRNWKLAAFVSAVALFGLWASLHADQTSSDKQAELVFPKGAVGMVAPTGARAMVVDITPKNQVDPVTHVVYDFEKKTVSYINFGGGNQDVIYVKTVSYLKDTK